MITNTVRNDVVSNIQDFFFFFFLEERLVRLRNNLCDRLIRLITLQQLQCRSKVSLRLAKGSVYVHFNPPLWFTA